MRRVFAVDVLACPGCNGRLRLVAVLEASMAAARILQHLRLSTEVLMPAPRARPRRPTSVCGTLDHAPARAGSAKAGVRARANLRCPKGGRGRTGSLRRRARAHKAGTKRHRNPSVLRAGGFRRNQVSTA